MNPPAPSSLDLHADQLDKWLKEDFTLGEIRRFLEQLGCKVSTDDLDQWRRRREDSRLARELLEQIIVGAKHSQEVQAHFADNPPPELETLIKLHRVKVLELCAQPEAKRETINLLTSLMRPVLDWARLEEKRKERQLNERRYQDELQARKTNAQREWDANKQGGLSPETLAKIEQELKLM